jgi:hypothetical protein
VTLNIENISRNNLSPDEGFDPTTEQVSSMTSRNNEKNYDFDDKNDLQFVLKNGIPKLKLSINSKIPDMILKRVDKIRVILSYENIVNLSTETDKIVYDFFFNVNDYYDFNKRDKILKSKVLKNIALINSSNSSIEIKTENMSLFDKVLNNRKSLGEILDTKRRTSEIFELNNQEQNKIIYAEINTALMSHVITTELNPFVPIHIKIIELQRSNIVVDSRENYTHYSINSYFIPSYANTAIKFAKIVTEKNNILSVKGFDNKSNSVHELDVINEKNDYFRILSKESIHNEFKRELIDPFDPDDQFSKKIHKRIQINRNTPAIYRIIDNNKKLKDVFIGDVKEWLFNSTPSISVFSLNANINIIVKNVPQDFLKYIVYRTEGKNLKTRIVVETEVSNSFDVSRNLMLLADNTVDSNKIYRYQIKFITNNDAEILTNYSNEQMFIKPSGSYSLSTELITNDDGISKIVSTTTVPVTVAQLLFDDISRDFPDIDEERTRLLVDNYSYLSFVKFMRLNRETGEITTLGLKTATENIAELSLHTQLDHSKFGYFCEMFSSSLVSALENINSSSRYLSSTKDHFPILTETTSAIGTDRNNFLSKFSGYYSMNEGTLVYGRALADLPGNIIESAKTGVISVVQIPEQEIQDIDTVTSFDIEIIDRNIPKISIELNDVNIQSALIVTSEEASVNYRVEKAVYDDNKFIFYDVNAQFDFMNEIVDYYIVPVYDNYKIKNIEKIGTVLCSKNNFRKI